MRWPFSSPAGSPSPEAERVLEQLSAMPDIRVLTESGRHWYRSWVSLNDGYRLCHPYHEQMSLCTSDGTFVYQFTRTETAAFKVLIDKSYERLGERCRVDQEKKQAEGRARFLQGGTP